MGRVVMVGKTSIHWAAATNKKNSTRLVHEGLLAMDHEGLPALYLAVPHSNTCKINALNSCLRSALHSAALAYRLLLDRSAKVDLID